MTSRTAWHERASRHEGRRGFSFCEAGGETGDETKRFTLRVGVSRYAPFSLAQIERHEHFRTRNDAMGIRYGRGMTGRTAGRAAGRETGRRERRLGDKRDGKQDGTKIAYPNDGDNAYKLRFD